MSPPPAANAAPPRRDDSRRDDSPPPRHQQPPGSSEAPPPPGKARARGAGKGGAGTRFSLSLLPFFVSLAMLLTAGLLLYLGGELVPCRRATTCEPVANAAGFLGGSLVGVISLGVFMALDNRRKALKSGRYSDWPRWLMPWISGTAWLLGMIHIYGFALYLSRLL